MTLVLPSQVYWFGPQSGGQGELRPFEQLEQLMAIPDGWVWLDVAEPDDELATLLRSPLFACPPRAVKDCLERNHVSRLRVSGDCLFVVVHKPYPGPNGHVHYLELDKFVAPRFLVTVHGPCNPLVPPDELLVETNEAASRIASGYWKPTSPIELSHALSALLTLNMEGYVNELAARVGDLERRVMSQQDEQRPQDFLDELFRVRHTLLTVRTMTSQSSEIFARAQRLMTSVSKTEARLIGDTRDQYLRLSRVTASQLDFLHGVTDYYRARTDTKMTIAAERLAVIAAITLPVTAISSLMGMNVIVNGESDPVLLAVLLGVMGLLSLYLLRWAKKQGWW